jgi:hypothetical protein
MANWFLFLSSCGFGSLHLLLLYYFQPHSVLLVGSILCGVTTSIWNHGVTSKIAMYADRLMMWVGCLINVRLISQLVTSSRYMVQLVCYGLLISSAMVYIVAKRFMTKFQLASSVDSVCQAGDIPHGLAHAILTLMHAILIIHYSTSCAVC